MNTRIKIYCVLLAICYIGIFVNTFYNDFDEIKDSFMQGVNSHENRTTTLSLWLEPHNNNDLNLVLHNKISGGALVGKAYRSKVWVDVPTKDVPTYLFAIEIACMVVGIFIIIAFFAFPILFFNVIYNVTRNKTINDGSITKIRIMGWTLIVYYLMDALLNYKNIATAKHIINLENFNLSGINLESNLIFLSLGFVTLLLAEIAKVSLKLKEEQDLTI